MNIKNEVNVLIKYNKRIIYTIGSIFIVVILLNSALESFFAGFENFKGKTIQNIIIYSILLLFISGIILSTKAFNVMGTLGFSRKNIAKAIFAYLIKLSLIVAIIISVLISIINTIYPTGDVIMELFFGVDLSKGFGLHLLINSLVLSIIILFSSTFGVIIGSMFISKGILYGLSLIAICVVITLFFIREIAQFALTGSQIWLNLVVLIISSILFFIISFYLLQHTEFKK